MNTAVLRKAQSQPILYPEPSEKKIEEVEANSPSHHPVCHIADLPPTRGMWQEIVEHLGWAPLPEEPLAAAAHIAFALLNQMLDRDVHMAGNDTPPNNSFTSRPSLSKHASGRVLQPPMDERATGPRLRMADLGRLGVRMSHSYSSSHSLISTIEAASAREEHRVAHACEDMSACMDLAKHYVLPMLQAGAGDNSAPLLAIGGLDIEGFDADAFFEEALKVRMNGATLLIAAAEAGAYDFVECLVRGCKQRDRIGYLLATREQEVLGVKHTALHAAAAKGKYDVCKLLVQTSPLQLRGDPGHSPIDVARQHHVEQDTIQQLEQLQRESKQFAAFLSHHKADAESVARDLKTYLEEQMGEQIFLEYLHCVSNPGQTCTMLM